MGIFDTIKEKLKGRDSMTLAERAKFEARKSAMASRRYKDEAYTREKIRDARERGEWKLELERARSKNRLLKSQAKIERSAELKAMRRGGNDTYDPLGVGSVLGDGGGGLDMGMLTGDYGSSPKRRKKGGDYINLLEGM